MDAAEAADTIAEAAEEHGHGGHIQAIEAHEARERFRNRAALVIAVLAAILAVCEVGGDNAKNAMIDNNIRASDAWAFYQAKNVRQTQYKLAADELKRELVQPAAAPAVHAAAQADFTKYDKTAARYEDEPGGEGKKQLTARAKGFEEARDIAGERHEFFDFAQMVLQLGIVLGSVSILAVSRPLLLTAGGLGLAGLAMLLNGFFLLVTMPH